MKQSSPKVASLLFLCAAVCIVVVVAHWPVLSAKALYFDDHQYIFENPMVQNPGWASAGRFLTEVLKPSTVRGYYQPLTMISLMLDYAAGGRENNLRPFHITSLVLHTANTALIIVLLYMLFDNIWLAAAAGLLFGVHPMTIESVAWIGERKTLLAAFFAFWSLILYVRYARTVKMKFYIGCFLMYLLALMSKPTSTPLPVVMLLMDYWPLKRLSAKTFIEKMPLFIMGIISAVITYISQHRSAATVSPIEYGPRHILLVVCRNIIFYLYKILWPADISWFYAFPKHLGLSSPMVLAGVIGTCILIPVLFLSLRWTRAALTGWLIFFVTIFPTMGAVGFTNVIAADKYAYLPAVGLLMTLTAFLIWLCRGRAANPSYQRRTSSPHGRWTRIIILTIVLILAGAEAFATQRYYVYWQDTAVGLFKHVAATAPDSPIVCYNLAFELAEQNRLDEAIDAYKQAIKNKPDYVDAYNNLGAVYGRLGRWEEATQMFKEVLKLKPNNAFAFYNLGNIYGKQNHWLEAAEAFRKTTQINPGDAQAHFRLGIACLNMGEKDLAIKQCEILKNLDPQLAQKLADYIH